MAVQAILGHKHIDTSLNYARLYDGTVAADYYRAIGEIENRMELHKSTSEPLANSGQLLALVDALRDGTLNEFQKKTVQELRRAILTLLERGNEMTGDVRDSESNNSIDKPGSLGKTVRTPKGNGGERVLFGSFFPVFHL